jgi:hypothetical protein
MLSQSPIAGWRNRRIVGYQGLSSRPTIHRQSGMKGNNVFQEIGLERDGAPEKLGAGGISTELTMDDAERFHVKNVLRLPRVLFMFLD